MTKSTIGKKKKSSEKMKKSNVAKFWLMVENGNPSPIRCTRHPNSKCTRDKNHAGWCNNQDRRKKIILKKVKRHLRSNKNEIEQCHRDETCTRPDKHRGHCKRKEKSTLVCGGSQFCTKRRNHDGACKTHPCMGCIHDPRCQIQEIPHDGKCQIDKQRLVATTKEHKLTNGEYHIFMGKILKKRKRGDFVISWEISKNVNTGIEYTVDPMDRYEIVKRASIMPHK